MNEADGRRYSRSGFLAATAAMAAAGAAAFDPAIAAADEAPPWNEIGPDDGLKRMLAGNKKFVAGDLPSDYHIQQRREALATGQAPFAAVLTCADSRVVPNLIFLQGLGGLFTVRVAGNFPDDLALASLEYTIEHLGTRLVVVLGHEGCGAVKATYDAIASQKPLPPHLSTIERLIGPGIYKVVRDKGSQEAAVVANVKAAVKTLKNSHPVVEEELEKGHIKIVGAEYHLKTGEVTLVG